MKSPIESMIKWHQGTADAKKGFDSDLADEIVSALTEADALWLEAVKPLVEAAWGVLGWRHTDPPTNTLRGLAEALAPFAESHETIKARRAKKEEGDA